MASNDESVIGIPQIQCPECGGYLGMSERKLRKFSAEQLKLRMNRQVMGDMASLGALGSYGDGVARKMDSEPEREFVVVSCENERCGQYVNVKVFELPKLRVSTAKLV